MYSDVVLWVRIWKTIPVFQWIKGAQAFREERYQESAEYYRKGLSKYANHPAHFSARFDLAYCLERLGHYEEAIQELSYITTQKYPMLECYQAKARLLSFLGRYSTALETLRQGRKLFPQDISLIISFMHLSLSSGLAQNELDEMKEILETRKFENKRSEKEENEIQVALAHYELLLGDSIVGDTMLVRALSSGNAPVEGLLIRGKRLFSLGRYLQAREHFKTAMIQSPGDPHPLRLLSESYLASGAEGELTWAIQLAESACRLSKWKSAESVELLSRAYESNKEAEKAELFMERLRHMSQASNLPFRKKAKDLMGLS